jgi:uncharacterized membrane protein YcaP (DUF421 family)
LFDWLTIVWRSLGALAILFLMTRILGKKQMSQLTFFEYITGITLGELAGFISTDMESHYLLGITSLLVWFLVPLGLEYLTLKSRMLREWFEGKGRELIRNGKVLEANLRKERLSADELLEQLRTKNVFNVADVEFAMMEASGEISVLLKKEKRPLTLQDMGMTPVPDREPVTVVSDAEILNDGLAKAGYTREWLKAELQKLQAPVEEVFLAQVDSNGQLTVDLYNDAMKQPKPQTKPLLLATLKKCQADLECFGLSTDDPEAKAMYQNCAARMDEVVQSVGPALRQ